MYDRDLIDSILKSASIVEVVRHYLPGSVVKKGKDYVAQCPFHDDHDPSLMLNVKLNIYKCFACGHGGNAIKFVQEYEKCSFPEAVRKTAEIIGFQDPRLEKDLPVFKVDPEKQKLFDCINDLQAYYRYCLTTEEGQIARDYLTKRHLEKETCDKFGIGYAPRDGAKTVEFLQKKGHSLKTIEDLGIATASAMGGHDRNAGRLTFPLKDAQGQVVGFSARQLIKDPNSGKYMNSPETAIFHKGDVLYNYHNISSSARHDGYCYVLEGFMDVMALDKAGLPDAIALMGTALTEKQTELLRRLNCEIRLCLDGDEAGQMGMMRALGELQRAKIPYRIVDYGGDLRDPDDILQEEGPQALVAKMENLVDSLDFRLSYYLNVKHLDRKEDKTALIKELAPALSKEEELVKDDHIAKLAKALAYEPSAIRRFVDKVSTSQAAEEQTPISYTLDKEAFRSSAPVMERLSKKLANAEDTILYYLLQDADARKYVASIGNPIYSTLQREIAFLLLEYAGDSPTIDVSGLMSYIDQNSSGESDLATGVIADIASRRRAALPYSSTIIDDCRTVIEKEKSVQKEDRKARKAIESGDQQFAIDALKDLAAKKSEDWKRKRK